jgi:L,D-peptidoglycan transpeptidase YkuD (ErfK/YbiS/YcfS/YnhG family)
MRPIRQGAVVTTDTITFSAFADGRFWLGRRWVCCALGRAGIVAAPAKREGDGATPAGIWTLRQVLWRSDRLDRPDTGLPTREIRPGDGWCDAPGDPCYNRAVELPYPVSAEDLWRPDGLYDVVVVLGYNDAPVVDGGGSAIFLHLARPDYPPTQGCVGLAAAHLNEALALANPGAALMISADKSVA